ncbi:MAG: zinc transporter ZntB [Deltaproteobacteria bacterium]|nr:zinc transporter ZntB [Deltaproteobacteria bacterium]
MQTEDSLVYAYVLDGKGSGKVLGWTEINNWEPDHGLLWLHLDSKIPEAQEWLENKSGIASLTCESLLEKETRPRNILSNDGLLLILRGVNCNPGADPEDMVAIRMLLNEHRIISMRYRRIKAVQDVKEAIDAGKGPTTSGEFLVMVTERLADRMGDVVAEIDDNVDELEDTVLTAESYELRSQLAELRRTCIGLRRYIAPQRDVLARLLHDRIQWLSELDRAHLREVAERTARFVEDIDAARERAAVTQEELNNRLSEQMNKAMYLLSIVAAIFLPLGLLTGLLGINVGGIPGTESKWAFTLVTAALVGLAIFLVAWFKRIKWL